MKKSNSLSISLLSLLFLSVTCSVFAADLSVRYIDGTTRLDFGKVTNYDDLNEIRRLEIRVTNATGNGQYRIKHELVDVLREDSTGEVLDDFLVFSTENTSLIGGLPLEVFPKNEPVDISEERLFLSNGNGEDDSFYINYSLNPKKLTSTGMFTGRMRIWLYQDGQVAKNVDVWVKVDTQQLSAISIKSSSSNKNIMKLVYPKVSKAREDYIDVSLPAVENDFYELKLESQGFVDSFSGVRLPADFFDIKVEHETGVSSYDAYMPFVNRSVVFRSTTGNSTDIRIYFKLKDSKVQQFKSAIYESDINFSLSPNFSDLSEDFSFVLDVKPVFNFKVDSLSHTGLAFRELARGKVPEKRALKFKIDSNTDKPYVIVQKFKEPLQTDMGKQIDQTSLKIKQNISTTQRGTIKFPQESSVSVGDTIIYESDEAGSAAEFEVEYLLSIPEDAKAGEYSADISFALMEK